MTKQKPTQTPAPERTPQRIAEMIRVNHAGEHGAVVVQVLVEGFDGRRGAAAVVLGQRDEHPAHARQLVLRAVEDVLAGVDHLLGAGQGPVHLPVAHAALVRSG